MTEKFRLVAYAEAVSYLALLSAVILYRVFDGPDYVGLLGPLHGIIFLALVILVLKVRESQGWGVGRDRTCPDRCVVALRRLSRRTRPGRGSGGEMIPAAEHGVPPLAVVPPRRRPRR